MGEGNYTVFDRDQILNIGGLIAIGLDEDDELAWVRLTDGSSELIVATRPAPPALRARLRHTATAQ